MTKVARTKVARRKFLFSDTEMLLRAQGADVNHGTAQHSRWRTSWKLSWVWSAAFAVSFGLTLVAFLVHRFQARNDDLVWALAYSGVIGCLVLLLLPYLSVKRTFREKSNRFKRFHT
jgi:hypothetical protein